MTKSYHSRDLEHEDDSGESNRLDVAEDGTSAECALVGLMRFNWLKLAYENALAMQLAIKHLNEGDSSLVPELEGLSESCPITFSLSFNDTKQNPIYAFSVVDELTRPFTEYTTSSAIASEQTEFNSNSTSNSNTTLTQQIVKKKKVLPCGIIGAMSSITSKRTGMVTGLRGFPQISMGSTSTELNDKLDYPYFGRTIPDDAFIAETFVRFLHDTVGIRHIFVIFESDPYTVSVHKSIKDAIRKFGWEPGRESINNDDIMYMEDQVIESATTDIEVSEEVLKTAIRDLKVSKFRCVVSLTFSRDVNDRMMKIGLEEGVAGQGTHQWWFFEGAGLSGRTDIDPVLVKAYAGVGSITQSTEKESALYSSFQDQSEALKRELNERYDRIASGSSELHDSDSNNMQYSEHPEWVFGADVPYMNATDYFKEGKYGYNMPGFSYDATILLGLSACNEVAGRDLFLTGHDYFERIKRTNFTGVTGNVVLDPETGTRDGHSVQYIIENWLPNESEDSASASDNVTFGATRTFVYQNEDWTEVAPHVFNGGMVGIESLGPNPDLPPVDFQIVYVSPWILGLAWGLAALILSACLGFAIWTVSNGKSRVVRASQPFFLLLLCFGVALMALSIIPISFDHWKYFESSTTCHLGISLLALGFGITFSTLFAKTHRINRITASAKKFRRVKISVAGTLYPVAANFIFNIIVLAVIIFHAPATPETATIAWDDFDRPIEGYRSCAYVDARPYLYGMWAVNLSMVFLALFQAWRARHLSTEFAESHYIANALLINMVVLLCAVPVLYLVHQINPDAETFIDTSLVSVVSSTTLCFIFVPKILMQSSGRKRFSSIVSRYSSSNSMDRTGSSTRFSSGEKILTKKTQLELASEVKSLKRELAAMKRRQSALFMHNTGLRERLQEFTGEDLDDPNLVSSISEPSGGLKFDDDDEGSSNKERRKVTSSLHVEPSEIEPPGKKDAFTNKTSSMAVEYNEADRRTNSDCDSDLDSDSDSDFDGDGDRDDDTKGDRSASFEKISSFFTKKRNQKSKETSNIGLQKEDSGRKEQSEVP